MPDEKEKIPTITESIEQLRSRAEWWARRCEQLEERIKTLEAKKSDRNDRRQERQEEEERRASAALSRARAAAIRELVKLLPEAVSQAKQKPPRPALLRLILRATK